MGIAVSGWGQVSSGSLLGDVRDEKAASVAGVVIQARNNQTGFSRSAVSNDFGSYRIDDLLPGAYTVTAQHDGFQTVTVSPLFVEVDQKARLDFDLRLGSAHETVTVAARTSPLQTDEASEGYQLGSDFIEALPLMTSCPNPPSWRGIAPGPNVTSVMILRPSNGTALN